MTQEPEHTDAQASESARKDHYFEQLAFVSENMIRDFGHDFAMGALVLAARYIAERQGSRSSAAAVPEAP
jgi:hypothetical protein